LTFEHHNKPLIGLALGSGASRGWAHIGIIDALAELDITIDIISGCSIGSLVGAAYVAGNLNKLEDWISAMSTRELARFFEVNLSLNGFVDTRKLNQFMRNYICEEKTCIEDLNKPFACVATDLQTGQEIWFTEGSVHEAIWSSISMPGLFPPIKYQNKWLVDGGLVNPVPVSLCRAMGAEIVIAVSLNSDLVGKRFNKQEKHSPKENNFLNSITDTLKNYSGSLFKTTEEKENLPGLIDTVVGSMNIVEDRLTRSRMAGDPPDILFTPRLSHIGLLEFQRGKEAIEEGRKAVTRMMPEINFLLDRL